MAEDDEAASPLLIERLSLSNFRNYRSLGLDIGPEPVVFTGANGAGKTNILEAVSLLAPGQGLRRVPFPDLTHASVDAAIEGWAVSALTNSRVGRVQIGTGIDPARASSGPRAGRVVRIDGESKGSPGILAEYIDCVWLTPTMDGLFIGPAAERRRFLDRLVICFDPAFRTLAGRFERAMQSRNKLLSEGHQAASHLDGFELVMAETAVAIAAARVSAISQLNVVIAARQARNPTSPFPWSHVELDGLLETGLAEAAALDVEEDYRERLGRNRNRDAAAARTLEGPHRSDLVVTHGPKTMPAKLCSTGEQKSLLLGLVLAQAELIAHRHAQSAPLVLLDEVTAHLDEARRAALFDEILHLRAQAWMTGTDAAAFAALKGCAQLFLVADGMVSRQS